MKRGRVVAVCISSSKGEKKKDVGEGLLVADSGLKGDAHAGSGHRQVSLLAIESVEKMRSCGLNVGPGDFAENLTISGIDLCVLPVGTILKVGDAALLKVSQIGKECHDRCAIYHQAGDCVMPREGVFAEVMRGGVVRYNDEVEVLDYCNTPND